MLRPSIAGLSRSPTIPSVPLGSLSAFSAVRVYIRTSIQTDLGDLYQGKDSSISGSSPSMAEKRTFKALSLRTVNRGARACPASGRCATHDRCGILPLYLLSMRSIRRECY